MGCCFATSPCILDLSGGFQNIVGGRAEATFWRFMGLPPIPGNVCPENGGTAHKYFETKQQRGDCSMLESNEEAAAIFMSHRICVGFFKCHSLGKKYTFWIFMKKTQYIIQFFCKKKKSPREPWKVAGGGTSPPAASNSNQVASRLLWLLLQESPPSALKNYTGVMPAAAGILSVQSLKVTWWEVVNETAAKA